MRTVGLYDLGSTDFTNSLDCSTLSTKRPTQLLARMQNEQDEQKQI